MTATDELIVASDMQELPRVIEFVRQACIEAQMASDEIFACELATDEACTNIIEHAYRGRSDGLIRIWYRCEENRLIVQFRDHGSPFDPTTVEPPDLSSNLTERDIGGLGLHFMRNLMDEVRFEFDAVDGNTLTMVKWLGNRDAEG